MKALLALTALLISTPALASIELEVLNEMTRERGQIRIKTIKFWGIS